ncbi:Protein Kinase C Iota Type [Manis pentadactyla]|nr:Protein Kinase C Iota Type [Manis pentadactyla]
MRVACTESPDTPTRAREASLYTRGGRRAGLWACVRKNSVESWIAKRRLKISVGEKLAKYEQDRNLLMGTRSSSLKIEEQCIIETLYQTALGATSENTGFR